MKRISVLFIVLGVISLSSVSSRAQTHAIGAGALILTDGSGNTLTISYPNTPPVAGNSVFNFLPGGGSSIPGGTLNGQTLWWNNATSFWTADNFLTNTGSAIGIGTPTPGSPLDVQHTFTQTTAQIGVNALIKINPSAPSSVRYDAVQGLADIEGTNQITGNYVEGVHGQTTVGQFGAVTQPVSYIVGTVGQSSNYSTQTITEADGIYGEIENLTTGTITSANAVNALMVNTGGGILTNASGLHIFSPENTATITNLYGIYVAPQTAGTNNWPIFLSDGSLTGSIFNIDKFGNTTAVSLSVTSGNITAPTSVAGTGTALALTAGGSGGANSGADAYLQGGNASGAGTGGQSSVNGGNGVNGGDTYLHGGAGSSSGTGGFAHVWGGNGGSGGLAEVIAGSATSGNNYGGNTNIQAGTGFGNGFGGSVTLAAGPGGTTGAGGGIYFQTSPTNAASSTVMGITNSGTLQVMNGNITNPNSTGQITLSSGNGTSGNQYGGNNNIQAGTGFGNGFGGSVTLIAGPGGATGAGGGIYFQTSPSNAAPSTVMGITNSGTLQVGSANQFQVDNSGNVSTTASLTMSANPQSVSYTVSATDFCVLESGSGTTVKLPATATAGRIISVKFTGSSPFHCTLSGNGHNIDGISSFLLNFPGGGSFGFPSGVTVIGDGTNWWITGESY